MARRKTQVSLRQVWVTAGLLIAIVWLSFLVAGIFHKEQLARQTVADTRKELAELDSRKQLLSNTVHDLDTERGQEASMRETFGVARPGEEVIVVVPQKQVAPPPQLTWWQKVQSFLDYSILESIAGIV